MTKFEQFKALPPEEQERIRRENRAAQDRRIEGRRLERLTERRAYPDRPRVRALHRIKAARGCQRCGDKSLPVEALEWHHRDPKDKSFEVVRAPRDERAGEIKKCDVLCGPCHDLAHEELKASL
jgi:hypothetical protein